MKRTALHKLLAATTSHMSVVWLPPWAGILHKRFMGALEDQTSCDCLWFQFHITGDYTLGKDLISGTISLWYYGCGCCCLIYCGCHAVGMSAKLERICSVIIWMQIITSVWTLYNCVSHMTVDYVWNTDMQVSVEVCFCILFLSETRQSYSLWALLSGNPR